MVDWVDEEGFYYLDLFLIVVRFKVRRSIDGLGVVGVVGFGGEGGRWGYLELNCKGFLMLMIEFIL